MDKNEEINRRRDDTHIEEEQQQKKKQLRCCDSATSSLPSLGISTDGRLAVLPPPRSPPARTVGEKEEADSPITTWTKNI